MERYNIYIVILCIFAVTSLVEVWIEIQQSSQQYTGSRVTSLVEVWIEIILYNADDNIISGHFPCGSVD